MADFDDLDLDEDFDDLDSAEEESPKAKAKRSSSKGAKAAPKGIGASAVAEKLGANPKTFRAWLRRKAEELGLTDREPKSRYTWANWKDPELVAIMKSWKEDSHERGGGRKSEEEAPAKKAPVKRTRRKAS